MKIRSELKIQLCNRKGWTWGLFWKWNQILAYFAVSPQRGMRDGMNWGPQAEHTAAALPPCQPWTIFLHFFFFLQAGWSKLFWIWFHCLTSFVLGLQTLWFNSHDVMQHFIFSDLRRPYHNSLIAPKVTFQFGGFVVSSLCNSRSERSTGDTPRSLSLFSWPS